ncbi:Putative ketopantoate reductase ApbA/PanE, 6-phosphogluconate dehydrogenase-like domain superfamily [Septoria linicola]|uniref:2-dehydropantoate 2-reductase n=1 Tax=Septoria linicola TaxID=215465 RepID=A0A9Q9AWB3_9PEZI|nr:putative ketopantoate reductase ApbA/PanE, 6-phosphogluconate dehydrogenase-like domain superfamily [Septoria linicola]USW53142.1 Putative ketopantoate reductase ApbA/PanE, 6-phosphogluconate dehydrogenase-like domain superfamily [Septoria linicola]
MGSAMQKARVLLVGSGGVGTMAAYALEKGGHAEVTAICRSNYETVKKNGFTIDSIQHGHNITGFRPTHLRNTIPNVEQEGLQFDYLVATTKNVPDVSPTLLDIISPAVTPGHTTILLLQNGLNIEKPIIKRFPNNIILSGVSLIGATEAPHGVIKHDDSDTTKCGPFPSQPTHLSKCTAAAEHFISMYNACNCVSWSFDSDVTLTRWRKLVYNSSYNSVSAIMGMDTARMRMSQIVIDDLIRPAMKEIIAIAKAAGVDLPEGVDEVLIRVDPTDTAFVPSMGQDAAKGNYIEMENIVGEPVREAERLGVPAPTLKTIYGFLRGIQLKTKERNGLWKPSFEEGNPYS